MSKPDLTYRARGIWIDFTPETPAGEDAYRQMVLVQGHATIFALHLDNVKQQLRAAGYIVRKAGKPKRATMSDDELLAALGGLSMKIIYINGKLYYVIREENDTHGFIRLFVGETRNVPEAQHTIPVKWWKSPPCGAIMTGGNTYEKSSVIDNGSGAF